MAPLIGNECFPVSVTKEMTVANSPVFIHMSGEDELHDQLLADSTVERSDDLLITSPYDEISHLLDLKTLEVPSRLLAKALTILEPIREDYALAPYTESFNWQGIVDYLRNLANEEGYQWPKSEFFLVVFRSRLNLHVDLQRLYELDMRSHEEATVSGGLLKYWYGTRNENGENLATCIWRSIKDAHLGGAGPWHKQARIAAREMYERIEFKCLQLTISDGAGEWEINDWKMNPDE